MHRSDQLDFEDFLKRNPPEFKGAHIDTAKDSKPLTEQMLRVYNVMKDGKARTVKAIAAITEDSETSVSAQLRNMRKPEYGSMDVRLIPQGNRLYEYRLILEKNDG